MARLLSLRIVLTFLAACGSSSSKPAGDAHVADSSDLDAAMTDAARDAPDEPCDGNVIGSDTVIDGPGAGAGNDGTFFSLVVHPTDPDIVYIGSEANGMMRSLDGGATWQRLRTGLRHFVTDRYPEIWDIQFAPSNPAVMYAATVDSPGPTHGPYPTAVAGVYKSTDAGLTWRQVNCGLSNSRAIWLQVDPTNADVATVGISAGAPTSGGTPQTFYDGGIFHTTNGGAMWTAAPMPSGYSDQSYWKSTRRAGTLLTYAVRSSSSGNNRGLLKSVDEGATWTAIAATPTGYSVNWDVSSDGMVFWVHEQNSFAMQHSDDAGATFTEMQVLTANGTVAVSPVASNTVLYSDISVLYRTEDGFMSAPTELEQIGVTEIVFAPSDPMIVYLASNMELYKSTDGGATFSPLVNLRTQVLNP